jgi:hypothetical protein
VSDERPTKVDGLEAHEVDDGLVVYQAKTDRVHSLNRVASVVFELCTGEHTEAEIAELVGEAWSLPAPPEDEVAECIAQLRSEGVIA